MERLSRREVLLAAAGSAALLPGCAPGFQLDSASTFDEVLDLVHGTDPLILAKSFTNHAPMIAEVLVQLGLSERMAPVLNDYSKTLDPMPPGMVLTEAQRSSELGHIPMRGSWVRTFVADVETVEPFALIQREWPNLCTGYVSDLFHGPIRLGHALRSYAREETPSRRREIGHALGHWASTDFLLPGKPGSRAIAGRDVVTALRELTPIPASEKKKGEINDQLAPLIGRADFIDAVETVDLSVFSVSQSITELTSVAARWFVATPDIWYLHCVTGSGIARLLLPALTAAQQRELVGCVFQSLAALHAIRGTAAGIPDATPSNSSFEAQHARAAKTTDGHVLKVLEACERESGFDPRPEFLAAASIWMA